MVGVDATERSSRCVLKRARPPVRKDAPVLAVSNAGFQIAYEVVGRGSGPGLLFAQSKVGWSRMGYVEVLKERGKVLVVDPRVYGDSSRATREADYSLGAFYDDLLAAADAVGLDQFVAWGYSNTAARPRGGARHQVRPSRGSGLRWHGPVPELRRSHRARRQRSARSRRRRVRPGRTFFDWRAARAFYRDYAKLQATFPSRLHIPSALVYGADDSLVAPIVAQNRERLEQMGFTVTALEGS